MKYGIFITKDYLQWRLKNLTSTARKVEEILLYYLDFNTATSNPSIKTMEELSGLGRCSIIRGIAELESKKVINKIRKQGQGYRQYFYNQYIFLNYIKKQLDIPNSKLTDQEVDSIIDDFLKGYNG